MSAPKLKLGPVRNVRYDEDGRVLGWSQSHINEEGTVLSGGIVHTTPLGRKRDLEDFIRNNDTVKAIDWSLLEQIRRPEKSKKKSFINRLIKKITRS